MVVTHNRLVYSPWNTTEAFVKSHLERDGNGRMELQGIGDPSGRGEAYSFVRIAASGFANILEFSGPPY